MKKLILITCLLLVSVFAFSQWTWQNPLSQGNPLRSVHFLNANEGFMVGNNGTIIRTIDGGTTWSTIPSGTRKRLTSICFIDENTGFISGYGGTILKSVDGGLSWVTLSTGTTRDLYSISFPSANTGFASGYGLILKTSNSGETWN